MQSNKPLILCIATSIILFTITPCMSGYLSPPTVSELKNNAKLNNDTIQKVQKVRRYLYRSVKRHPLFVPIDTIISMKLKALGKNKSTVLKIPWHLRFVDYQEFIKQVHCINKAIQTLCTDPSLHHNAQCLKQAIQTRIELMDNTVIPIDAGGYLASLSDNGRSIVDQAQEYLKKEGIDTSEGVQILKQLMHPKEGWFIHLNDNNRLKSVKTVSVYDLIPTIGCSPQCDHCSRNTPFCVFSMPCPWIKQAKEIWSFLRPDWRISDFFRDYYDFVFLKSSSDIITEYGISYMVLVTAGLRPHSLSAYAFEELLAKKSELFFNIEWSMVFSQIEMRRFSQKRRISFLKYNFFLMRLISKRGKKPLVYKYNFFRVDEPLQRCLKCLNSFRDIMQVPQGVINEGRLFQLMLRNVKFSGAIIEQRNSESRVKENMLFPDGSIVYVDFGNIDKYRQVIYNHVVDPLAVMSNGRILCYHCDLDCTRRKKYLKKLGLTETGALKIRQGSWPSIQKNFRAIFSAK